jgi:hypothetical protein
VAGAVGAEQPVDAAGRHRQVKPSRATGNYPEVAGLPEDSLAISGRDALEFGLQALLDGLESFLATRTRKSGGSGRA